jgi:dihydroneopterin triphosphate diphosphatase
MAEVVASSVQVVVFRRGVSGSEFLLLQRASTEPVYPDMWQIVTGTIDAGERAIACAHREVREETGLAPVRFWILPQTASFYEAGGDRVHLVPCFAAEVAPDAVPVLSDEHVAFVWLPYELAWRRLVWPGHRASIACVQEYVVGEEEAGRLLEVPMNPS